ncbi:hypothetical protein Bbelb_356680 [Branchiostoma belcheri]|nr:hypothetical protein Bbelb_356680 [Branchiostoma belcheri]
MARWLLVALMMGMVVTNSLAAPPDADTPTPPSDPAAATFDIRPAPDGGKDAKDIPAVPPPKGPLLLDDFDDEVDPVPDDRKDTKKGIFAAAAKARGPYPGYSDDKVDPRTGNPFSKMPAPMSAPPGRPVFGGDRRSLAARLGGKASKLISTKTGDQPRYGKADARLGFKDLNKMKQREDYPVSLESKRYPTSYLEKLKKRPALSNAR